MSYGLDPTPSARPGPGPVASTAIPAAHARLLRFADPGYRNTLQGGLGLVLNGILLMIVIGVVGVFLNLGQAQKYVPFVNLAQFAVALMIAWGYWKYTTPDPGFAAAEQSNTARILARVGVLTNAVCTLVLALIGFVAPTLAPGASMIGVLAIAAIACTVLTLVAWVIQFVAIMTYTAWMARRLPDETMARKANRYRWLLPVIAIVGVFLFMLGPLIALVLYWNLLQALRKSIQAIL